MTLTVTLFLASTPPPVQVSVKVVTDVMAGETCLPKAGTLPLQLELQLSAFWLDQVSVTVPPEVTSLASAVSVTVGAGGVGTTSTA